MEMDSLKLDHDDNSIEETTSAKQLLPSDSPDMTDIFGEPILSARVGDDYQVEIPPIETEADYLQLLANPMESEVIVNASHYFLIGLPIPITWIRDEMSEVEDKRKGIPSNPDDALNAKGPIDNKNLKKNQFGSKKKRSRINIENLSSRSEDVGATEIGKAVLNGMKVGKGNCPVPGSSGDPWSDTEVENFVLGLYIFGKNFVQVRRFINKKMGDILSFYYGAFYRSDAYFRWSGRQKIGSRKRITGRKIFTGWRQQVLLSRLLAHVPDESQKALLEESMLFADGKTSLEEYVSFLKSTVGIHNLVEAIGIGKGKDDLTEISMEPGGKNNHQLFPICPKIPSGKACSSLTCSDIVKFLTGGYRLSKARCNDIFWEAVWPRLLAKGWHSEQPKNQSYYISSKHCLVFLMPGVKKFLRRKLVKGEHYFDSVTDVLSKVALEPELLELETEEATTGRSCNANGWVQEVTSDPDDSSDHQRHSYLKPRVPSANPNHMKFTIVDTSLVRGGNVKELRYLPVEFRINPKSITRSKESECQPVSSEMSMDSEKQLKKANLADSMCDHDDSRCMKFTIVDTSFVHRGKSSRMREVRCRPGEIRSAFELPGPKKQIEGESMEHSLDVKAEKKIAKFRIRIGAVNHKNQKATTSISDTVNKKENEQVQTISLSDNQKLKRPIKHQFSRRHKKSSSHSDFFGPIIKRRRLSACTKEDTNRIVENSPDGLASTQVGVVGLNDSLNYPNMGSPEEERNEPCSSIDLNISQITLETDHAEQFTMDVETSQISATASCSQSREEKIDSEDLNACVGVDTSETSIPRRQSTRNRPLTIRALEAFANGFLYVQKKQKKEEFHSNNKNLLSNPSRRARSKLQGTSNHSNAAARIQILQSKEEKDEKQDSVDKNDMLSKPDFPLLT